MYHGLDSSARFGDLDLRPMLCELKSIIQSTTLKDPYYVCLYGKICNVGVGKIVIFATRIVYRDTNGDTNGNTNDSDVWDDVTDLSPALTKAGFTVCTSLFEGTYEEAVDRVQRGRLNPVDHLTKGYVIVRRGRRNIHKVDDSMGVSDAFYFKDAFKFYPPRESD